MPRGPGSLKGSSVGSRGSRRLTRGGGGSVGFALAPLAEVESMKIEVVSGRVCVFSFGRYVMFCFLNAVDIRLVS